ncbi:MAG TPA: hypothetical protein VHB98_11180 [Chloroflexota bacterium]|nr:hypothetical protein [Chloroflexota bacterium]
MAGSLFIALSLALALLMPERHFTPAARADRTPWQQMSHTWRASMHLIRLRPALLTVLGIGGFYSVFSAGFDRLWSFHLLGRFAFPTTGRLTVVMWFGIIEAGINVTTLCGIEIARRFVDGSKRRTVVWALFAVDALTLACVIGFAVAGQFVLALGTFWLSTVVRGPRGALEQIWMNLDLDHSVRATVFSLRAQVGALAGIAGGPILGQSPRTTARASH